MQRSADPLIDQFFANKPRAFWLLHVGGWLAYALLRFLSGLANHMGLEFVAPTLIGTFTGFSLSLIMAAIFRHIMQLSHSLMWVLGALTVIVFASIFSAVEVWGVAMLFDPSWEPRGLRLLGAILTDLYVLTSWAALYFGINYYLQLREQSARNIMLISQTQAAQLKMLRYQLNPHFLFNTLNSISTLVMLKQSDRANAMLQRLSGFLRYTLIEEPSQMVTLAHEVEALTLYLDIERMRFEERLKFSISLAPGTEQALLPSLLLQPLVENAVKYAVAPMEAGAAIALSAKLNGARLHLELADTGPGMTNAPRLGSSGVGLMNIRDRLSQTYQDDHHFEIKRNLPHGVIVVIEIPYQIRTATMEAAA